MSYFDSWLWDRHTVFTVTMKRTSAVRIYAIFFQLKNVWHSCSSLCYRPPTDVAHASGRIIRDSIALLECRCMKQCGAVELCAAGMSHDKVRLPLCIFNLNARYMYQTHAPPVFPPLTVFSLPIASDAAWAQQSFWTFRSAGNRNFIPRIGQAIP
jgi:hypothetical protein